MAQQSDHDALVPRMLRQLAVWSAINAALLFIPAGTLDWPQAWVYVALFMSVGLVSGVSIARHDPALMTERMRGPIQREQKPWDKRLLLVGVTLFFAMHIVAGLDAVRFHISHMPVWLNVVGALGIVLAFAAFHVVLRTNAYAAAVVKVQKERGHQVISTGPYAYERHPMYAGAIFYFLGLPLLLGSWWAFAIGVVLIVVFAVRAKWEEEMLIAELPGYREYAARVRYRLIPGVW